MRRVLKWVGITLGSILGLLIVFVGISYIVSSSKLGSTFEVPTETVTVLTDSASVAEGKYLATAIGKCVECHGGDFGGKVFIDEPIIGHVAGKNITRGKGGIGAEFKVEDWVRAIRYGVKPDGKGLVVMPSEDYWYMSDEELGKLIGYLQSLPPVDREVEEPSLGILGRVLVTLGALPLFSTEKIDLKATRPTPPPSAPTAEYGEHLTKIGGCIGCHRPDFSGGPVSAGAPDWPPAANLTPHAEGLGSWTEAEFTTALRLGKSKDGRALNPEAMPWGTTALMTDDDMHGMWLYLRTVPAKETGT